MTRGRFKSIQKDTDKKAKVANSQSREAISWLPSLIESKWRTVWRKEKLYKIDAVNGPKYYALVELTYSSGDLHMGHWYSWTGPDVLARMKRMQGYNVLFPVGGFDSFGLPAENAAIKRNTHPQDWTNKNIEIMRRQFETMGPSFDWDKQVVTSDPAYYKWTQWMFLKFYKAGLAYRDKVLSNWCPECKTVLANEHVINGCCWRHEQTKVVQKEVGQWLFKIKEYADRLIWPKKPKVDWPESLIEGQNSWIGRKEGTTISYKVEGLDTYIDCWTSRPDTNFGATFIVLAPEHPFVAKLLKFKTPAGSPLAARLKTAIKDYVRQAKNKLELDRIKEVRDKTGIFTGFYAINNLNAERLPIWISDFVLASVGTGAVVGVPGHDRRDFEFARAFKLPVVRVVVGRDQDTSKITKIEQVQENEGTMINSSFLDGLDIYEAKEKIMDYLEKKGWGRRELTYHLRDWTVSRQRYWGAPIPIIYCRKCWENQKLNIKNQKLREGIDYTVLEDKEYWIHPVAEKDLPVLLPYKVDYTPTGKPPLATAQDFVKTTCPNCGASARRETETLDTYVDSSWYFLRYPDPNYNNGPFNPREVRRWLPIDIYFGGQEHTLGHTLYARFFTKVLKDLGFLDFYEFAKVRRHHGIILGPDGAKMSKSRGNVVNPDEEVKKYGADSVRLYLCFLGPHDQGGPWNRQGIEGAYRFLKRVWRLVNENKDLFLEEEKDAFDVLVAQHKTIQKVTDDIEGLHFNTAISAIMEFVNLLREKAKGPPSPLRRSLSRAKSRDLGLRRATWDEALLTLVKLLAPFAPHITEEIWQRYYADSRQLTVNSKQFKSVHLEPWPKYDADLARKREIVIVVQVDGRFRQQLTVNSKQSTVQTEIIKMARSDPKVIKHIKGRKIKRTVFVPGKLINFVTS